MAVKQSTKTVEAIVKGKNKRLMSLVPADQSPKLYVDLIKDQVMGVDKKGQPRSDDDLLLFLYTCKRTGLDPLTRQIYAVFRWDSRQGKEVMSIQTGIDGMRLVAQRSGFYAGQEDAIYDPVDEQDKYPRKAIVKINKLLPTGQIVPITASARWSEYVQSYNGKVSTMWEKMPYLMLGKCAEALALRKAFPNELSGIYAKEEMPEWEKIGGVGKLPTPEKFKEMDGKPVENIPDAEPVKPTTDIISKRNKIISKGDQNGKKEIATNKQPD